MHLNKKLEDVASAAGFTQTGMDGRIPKEGKPKKINRKHLAHEAPEIAALLLAHRARTPIAVGASEEYKTLFNKWPKPFVMLGWFWLTDAWLEPIKDGSFTAANGEKSKVKMGRWRFRFDWCNSGQTPRPWWASLGSDVECLFEGRDPDPDEPSDAWKIAGKNVSAVESLRFNKEGALPKDTHRNLDPLDFNICKKCGAASLDIYSDKQYCLNEGCSEWFTEKDDQSRKIILRALRDCKRVTPGDLGLMWKPLPLAGKTNSTMSNGVNKFPEASASVTSAGRDFWKGSCCAKCGMASERKSWKGWDCEGCGSIFEPTRKIWTAEMLRDPKRSINTGPRVEDGFQNFPSMTIETAMIWEDGLRICMHGIEDGSEVHHALSYHGKDYTGQPYMRPFDAALEALQVQGEQEVYFRRVATPRTKSDRGELISPGLSIASSD